MESTTYIFNGEFEGKFTHQFNKTDIYSYEIEALKPGVEPRSVVQSLGLPVDNTPQDSKFWEEFNEKVNIDADNLTEAELHKIVSDYL